MAESIGCKSTLGDPTPKGPLNGIPQVHEVAQVVAEYEVLLGSMNLRVRILRYFHLPSGMCYMAVPDHALVVDDPEFPFCPLRNYPSPEEALRDLVSEFASRLPPHGGQWVAYPVP